MSIERKATAVWTGGFKTGVGELSTQSGVLKEQKYTYASRFEKAEQTNPEELIAAAHASCFTMALSFALAREGFTSGTLKTSAKVTLDKQGEGFAITRSDLTLAARIDGIDQAQFDRIAADAKANCPVSKVLNAEITLTHSLNG